MLNISHKRRNQKVHLSCDEGLLQVEFSSCLQKPQRLTFFHRNRVQRTGFEFVSTGIEFVSTEIELDTQDLSSFPQELSWAYRI